MKEFDIETDRGIIKIAAISHEQAILVAKRDGYSVLKKNKMKINDAVSAQGDDGFVVEGNILYLYNKSVVIKDHDTDELSLWPIDKVTLLVKDTSGYREQLENRMRELIKNNDTEAAHESADAILVEALEFSGWLVLVNLYGQIHKWYA